MSTAVSISTALIFGALILKLTDLVKYARHRDWNGVMSLGLSSAAGIIAVLVLKTTAWAENIQLGGKSLDDLNVWSTVVFGVVAAMFASTVYDFKKAVDRTETSSTPRLRMTDEEARRARIDAYFSQSAQP